MKVRSEPSFHRGSSGSSLRDLASLVKLSHTVFALPFALLALLVATDGRPGWLLLGKVILAVVAARTAAMAFNRFADRRLDADNPRTSDREMPRGVVSPATAVGLTILGCAVFVTVAGSLGPICFWLAWPTLVVLLGYSYAKRFTASVHLWLGVALGLAPPAAWLAARGEVTPEILPAVVLGLAVSLWVAGFDILYSCQDIDFDRAAGLRSVPARYGIERSLWLARLLHAAAVLGYLVFGLATGRGWAYWIGVGTVVALLGYEHRLVRGGDLRRIGAAFFTMNGLVSVAMLGCTIVDLELSRI